MTQFQHAPMPGRPAPTRARIVPALALVAAMALPVAAHAQADADDASAATTRAGEHGKGGGKGMRMHGGMMMPGMDTHMLMRMADELGLSPEQRQTIRGFFESAQPGFRKLHDQMRSNTRLMLNTQPDDPRYQSVVQQVSQSSAELAQQMVLQSSQLRTQVYAVLTPEQKTKLKARQSEMQARWDERRAEREASRREAPEQRPTR
jgi:Spy/CpxP family protein refolding chaperone